MRFWTNEREGDRERMMSQGNSVINRNHQGNCFPPLRVFGSHCQEINLGCSKHVGTNICNDSKVAGQALENI
jgi:hypothetical protein